MTAGLAYWKARLEGSPMLGLPTDRPRPAVRRSRARTHAFTLPAALTAPLAALARAEDATLFEALLAAWQTVLLRYTGQDDFVVGAPAGADGDAARVLPLRADLGGDPSFRALLGRVRRAVREAREHGDVPLERVLRELGVRPSPDLHPVFQVMFVLREGGAARGPLPAGAVAGAAGVDLLLAVDAGGPALDVTLGYDPDLFDEATVGRMAGHLETLLGGALAAPDTRLSRLPLLTAAERRLLLEDWNATDADYPRTACLHQLFEANERRTPGAVALIFRDERLGYAELGRRANRLAHHLRSLGVGPEDRVGLCVERSAEMVVAILGVLKAGAAYVPLDPGYPPDRLAFMLDDARVSVLVTQEPLADRLRRPGVLPVRLDTDAAAIAARPDTDPASGVTAENLAYVIYTSGSTGRPKGIALRHGGVVNNLVDLNRSFAVGSGDRVLAVSSPSFDMCVYEVLGTLAAGGTIVMPDAALARDPGHWAELIRRHRVTVWNSAPAMLDLLVSHVEPRPELRPASLRVAILGGDWVPVTLPDRLKAVAPGVRVVVLGGATEASIHSIVYPVERTDPAWRSIPYGRPMANQRAYILDSHLEPVPVGVPGELYLGGVGLARGYFGRPDLTAEKFLADPFSPRPARIYRTGDLARWMPDGNIELLGRIDFQVKLHGHRIELGEVTAAIKQHPAVRQAVVVAREDQPGNRRLVAYVVPEGPVRPGHAELRRFLKDRLPGYMVPSAFVPLDAMPLSPNGKIDRRALPAPDAARPELESAYAPPGTPLEALLCGMWREVLGVERVGVHDDFFELGGSSVQGAVLVNRIQEHLGEIVHVVAIFDAPTVADLAAYLETHYPEAVARIRGTARRDDAPAPPAAPPGSGGRIDPARVQRLRELLRSRRASGEA